MNPINPSFNSQCKDTNFMWNKHNKKRGTWNVFTFFIITLITKKMTRKKPCHQLGGRWRIRTADPLLVRQTLWTNWAKRPLLVGMTRLERATPWSQTKYTTNCTTSRFSTALKRSFLKSTAKVRLLFELTKQNTFFFYSTHKKQQKRVTYTRYVTLYYL